MAKKTGYMSWIKFGLVRGLILVGLFFVLGSLVGISALNLENVVGPLLFGVLLGVSFILAFIAPIGNILVVLIGKFIYDLLGLDLGGLKYYFITIVPSIILGFFSTGISFASILTTLITGGVLTFVTILIYKLLGWRLPQ